MSIFTRDPKRFDRIEVIAGPATPQPQTAIRRTAIFEFKKFELISVAGFRAGFMPCDGVFDRCANKVIIGHQYQLFNE